MTYVAWYHLQTFYVERPKCYSNSNVSNLSWNIFYKMYFTTYTCQKDTFSCKVKRMYVISESTLQMRVLSWVSSISCLTQMRQSRLSQWHNRVTEHYTISTKKKKFVGKNEFLTALCSRLTNIYGYHPM